MEIRVKKNYLLGNLNYERQWKRTTLITAIHIHVYLTVSKTVVTETISMVEFLFPFLLSNNLTDLIAQVLLGIYAKIINFLTDVTFEIPQNLLCISFLWFVSCVDDSNSGMTTLDDTRFHHIKQHNYTNTFWWTHRAPVYYLCIRQALLIISRTTRIFYHIDARQLKAVLWEPLRKKEAMASS